MTLTPTLHCPCTGAHFEPAFTYDAPPAGETAFGLDAAAYRRSYDACRLCGHWFGRHDLDLSRLYDLDYVDATYGGPAGMAAKLKQILALPPERSDNAGRVACIRAFADAHLGAPRERSHRLLDVGAGIGVFPAAMKHEGWDVVAVEPDARTVAHLRGVVRIEAVAADLTTLSPADLGGSFDLVTFNKVLEHVENPVPLLAYAGSFLKPDGCCYIELPDVAAAVEGPGREEFFIEHHHVFSPQSFAMLAEKAGFSLQSLERIREPSGKFTLRGFLWRTGSTE